VFRAHWWAAVATVARLVGDLEIAEDAVQEACAAALTQWPAGGVPEHPRAWLIGVARHKALDRLRRESRRAEKEAAAVREAAAPGEPASLAPNWPPPRTTSWGSSWPAAIRPWTRPSGCR
jgi:RNA polymerase sigma-70 factor (ECF subfamily)